MSTAAKPDLAPAVLHVLLVGNKEEDFYLIREMLERTQSLLATELEHAHSLEEAKAMLQQKSYGLVLFEHETGDAEAVHFVAEFLHAGVSVPFILLPRKRTKRRSQTSSRVGHGIAWPNRNWMGRPWCAPSGTR